MMQKNYPLSSKERFLQPIASLAIRLLSCASLRNATHTRRNG